LIWNIKEWYGLISMGNLPKSMECPGKSLEHIVPILFRDMF